MKYIVFDLEWNQSNSGSEETVAGLPFEIIEIGAVRLDQNGMAESEFSQLIKPAVYREMHQITGKLIHLHMQELENGRPFVSTAEGFLEWCGKEPYRFCTWGPADLTELQRNMKFYQMPPLEKGPLIFLDVQKLFSIAYEDRKSRRSLEYAIDFLEIEKKIPFHRAYSDAYYTACILSCLKEEILENYSIDTYVLPKTRQDEIHVMFHDYMKYVSREFSDKMKAFEDREVISTKCYLCHRNIRKKIRWFSPNGKNYYSIALCPVHGYMKFKIRVRKSENDKVYVVKTSKFISEEDCQDIIQKRTQARQRQKENKGKSTKN